MKASWDWGGGDFETGLGAAAHMGNREIALFLLENGAALDLFAAAMLGYVDVVRAMLAEHPELRDAKGAHGIPLLVHAQQGGEQAKRGARAAGGSVIYEVFRQERQGQAFQHAGSFEAPDHAFADAYAREFYGRRGESEALWVVPREDEIPRSASSWTSSSATTTAWTATPSRRSWECP